MCSCLPLALPFGEKTEREEEEKKPKKTEK